MKWFFAVTCAVVAGAAPTLAAAAAGDRAWPAGSTVRIATEGAYKPWNFREKDGRLAGFEIDLVALLCADLKFRCPVQRERWGAMLRSLDDRKFDAVFAGMSITAPRRTKAEFTAAYATSPAVFVAAPGGRTPETPIRHLTLRRVTGTEQETIVALRRAFLNGVIGVQKGTTHEIFLREYIEGYAKIRTFANQAALDRETASGGLTAMLVGLGYAMPLVGQSGRKPLKIVGPRISGGPFGAGIGAAVRKGDTALADAFSAAIRKRLEDGSVGRLSRLWFGFDLSAKP